MNDTDLLQSVTVSVRRLSKPEIARRIQQAVAYQQTGRPDLAVQIYQEIYPLVVRDASVLRLYAIALVGAGKPKQADESSAAR